MDTDMYYFFWEYYFLGRYNFPANVLMVSLPLHSFIYSTFDTLYLLSLLDALPILRRR